MVPVGMGENDVTIMEAQGAGGTVGCDKTAMGIGAPSKSSRSHSEAERKRRQRINGHLATLRTLLPSASRVYTISL
jgi:Helix-loop-helix DNA-binding domain